MKAKSSGRKFNTPINIGGISMPNPDESESVDEQINTYLSGRRKRALEDAKMAELEHVAEDEKTGAARSRMERQLVEAGKTSPIKGEEVNMEETEKRVEEAAEVAASAASEGVSTEQATNLGVGKSRVVVIKPEPKEEDKEGAGGWSVFEGRPVRDPEGDYTFSQALKIAQLETPRTPIGDKKKSFGEELAEAKQALEALGIKVGSTAPAPRSLKEEVAEAMGLLESLGIRVGTNEQASLKEQMNEAKSLLEGLGLSIGIPGESLESVKETHHHAERMEELAADREWKRETTKTLSDLPEGIGRGLAGLIEKEEAESGGGGRGGGGELEYLTCTEEGCGAKIYITPETGNQVVCPKCDAIYNRKGTIEAGKE